MEHIPRHLHFRIQSGRQLSKFLWERRVMFPFVDKFHPRLFQFFHLFQIQNPCKLRHKRKFQERRDVNGMFIHPLNEFDEQSTVISCMRQTMIDLLDGSHFRQSLSLTFSQSRQQGSDRSHSFARCFAVHINCQYSYERENAQTRHESVQWC